MGRRLTVAQREEKGREAWRLSAMGYGRGYISEALGINHKTVTGLLEEERLKRRQEWRDEDLKSVEFYEGEIRRAEEMLDKKNQEGKLLLPLTSQNRTGLANVKLQARQQIDKIAGTHAPTKTDNKHRHDFNILDVETLGEELVGEIYDALPPLNP